MYCPECGTDAGEAKFCPECGVDLAAFRKAKAAAGAEDDASRRGAEDGRAAREALPGAPGATSRDEAPRGPSAALLWIIVAVVAAVVAGVVLYTQLGDDSGAGETTQHGGTPAATPAPVEPDLSGSYDELVQRANDLYDQGKQLFDQNQIDQGAAYFAAAATVYEAAWKKQAGDPAVGTDWAVALFYSGDIDGAIKRVETVLAKEPEFQKAWLNKGIFLTHLARMGAQMEGSEESEKLYDEARQAFVKAVAIDPSSDAGKSADAFLAELPK